MTICGVEVYGKETGEKPEEKKEERKEVMLELSGYDQSSVHSKYAWSAQKLVQYMGYPITDISAKWKTQTCTYSKNETGAWQSVSLDKDHEITKIMLIGRSDTQQERI